MCGLTKCVNNGSRFIIAISMSSVTTFFNASLNIVGDNSIKLLGLILIRKIIYLNYK